MNASFPILPEDDSEPISQGDTQPTHLKRKPDLAPISGGSGESPPDPTSKTPTVRPNSEEIPAEWLKKVPRVDGEATQVKLSAYQTRPVSSATPTSPGATKRRSIAPPTARRPSHPARPASSHRPRAVVRRSSWQSFSGCLLRLVFAGTLVLLVTGLCLVSIMFYQYYRIASTLPSISDLRERASQFETTRILDANGSILYEILDPNAGRRTYVPLSRIDPDLVAATIATEDKDFYQHPGFNLMAIGRAFWQNYQSGETVSGASTITQQLARTLLFTPEERTEQSYDRKIREAILAAEITRRYSKDEILELYLNEIYYGNLAYGVEAAAETYFSTSASNLTLGQAAFLAGLPQAPSIYDIYTSPAEVYQRLDDVLLLMYQDSQASGCIYVSNSSQKVCVGPVEVTRAADEMRNYPFKPPAIQMRYPHWVNYVRSLLESQYDPQTIYRSGFTVYTTLQPAVQDLAQAVLRKQVETLAGQDVSSGAMVVLRPGSGEILAMVGSADFYNEAIAGQVNMAVNPRQPGSAIKPLTYLAAFEKGWTPATLIWDVPSQFPPSGVPGDPSPPFEPVNYDGRFHGPVTVRTALGSSYNIPAVKALDFVGITDNPNTPQADGFLNFAARMGISTLNRGDYGLSLTLGGGEVTLLELTSAYGTLANYGRRLPAVAITRILDHEGNQVYAYQAPAAEQVIRPEHAYLVSSILSDNQARTPAFGQNSVLRLPFPAAVKTGTTNDFRDNWTVGYTPDVVVGVWVGNADYTPMQNVSGVVGAAPIWSEMMQALVQQFSGGAVSSFQAPAGVVEYTICEVSGTQPSEWCPRQRSELFAADQPPLPKDQDLWRKAVIDTWTGLFASQACPDFIDEQFVLNVQDGWARLWINREAQGRAWAEQMGFDTPVIFAPERECRADDPRPFLEFVSPREGERIQAGRVDFYVMADASNGLETLELEYGRGDKPDRWMPLYRGRERVRQSGPIATWELEGLPDGLYTFRLRMTNSQGGYAEKLLHLVVELPTPTPQPTDTPFPTEIPFPTSTPIPTWPPVETPIPGATETVPFPPPFPTFPWPGFPTPKP